MSQLTAHIVYATYQALDDTQREAFMRLIDEDKKKYQSQKKPKRKSTVPTVEELTARIMYE